jgi:hypothetical protein
MLARLGEDLRLTKAGQRAQQPVHHRPVRPDELFALLVSRVLSGWRLSLPYAGALVVVAVPKGPTWALTLSDVPVVRAPAPVGFFGVPFGDDWGFKRPWVPSPLREREPVPVER